MMSRLIHVPLPLLGLLLLSLPVLVLTLAGVDSAQAQTASQDIINTQINVSRTFDAAINEAMSTLIQSEIFASAANIGATLSLLGFAPVLMSVVRMYHADMTIDRDSFINRGMVLLVILLLLGTPTDRGRLLGSTLTGVNGVSNHFSDQVLVAAAGQSGTSLIAQEIAKIGAEDLANRGSEECAKIPEQGKREDCFTELGITVNESLEPYESEPWAQATKEILTQQLLSAINLPLGTIYGNGKYLTQFVSDNAGSIGGELVKSICWAMGQAFIIGIEHAKILMVLVSPIFVGLHMVPIFQGFFTTWLKNFLMMELAHLFFNLIMSLVALTMLNVTDISSLVFPLVVASLSIVFALALVAGGGISLYSAGMSAAAGAVSVVNNLRK